MCSTTRPYLCHVSDLLLHVLVGRGLGLHGVPQGCQGLTQSIGLPLGLEGRQHGREGWTWRRVKRGRHEGGEGGLWWIDRKSAFLTRVFFKVEFCVG